jgi:hypothetical protein
MAAGWTRDDDQREEQREHGEGESKSVASIDPR